MIGELGKFGSVLAGGAQRLVLALDLTGKGGNGGRERRRDVFRRRAQITANARDNAAKRFGIARALRAGCAFALVGYRFRAPLPISTASAALRVARRRIA